MTSRLSTLLLIGLLLAACGTSAPQPTLPPGERATPTPLPAAPTWREASAPITLENVQRISLLGRLEVPGSASTVFAYAISPDNTRLAALNHSFALAWDLVTGRLLFATSRENATNIYYSPDKDEIYTLTEDGGIFILNSEDGTYEESINAMPDYNGVSDFHRDEGLLALASSAGDIKVWDMFERRSVVTFSGDGSQPISLHFSPDSTRLAVAYENGIVHIWDWRNRMIAVTPAPLPSEQHGVVDQVRFSPDGQVLAGMTYSTGIIWNAIDGAQLHLLAIGGGGSAYLFRFSPQGDYIITGGVTSDATLWNVATGELAAALPGLGGNNIDAAFSPDGQLLFTSLMANGGALWNLTNVENGTIARGTQSFNNDNILNLLWTDDSFLLLMFDARGPVEVWGVP